MVVVKVFALHDPMLPLAKHRVRVEEIKSKLQSAVYGSIVGWDLRAPGILTAMCLDTRQIYLTVGTSSGYHTCWDMRFRLPIATIVHPIYLSRKLHIVYLLIILNC